MKKIFNLLAFVAVAALFTACDPMHETYKQLDASPTANPKTLTYTLLSTDYSLGGTGNKTGYFTSVADANTNIPKILNTKFPYGYDNGSNATITYATPATTVAVADSVYSDVAYTLTNADYKLLPSNSVTGYTDFSASQILGWLPYKYPSQVPNQLAVLTYNYYEAGVSSSSGTPTTDSFLFLNGAWAKIYTVSAAQYASVGRGTSNQFTPTDATNIPLYINTFLKADQTVAATAKAGDIKYVSFKYYATTKLTYQRVQVMIFDGTNWSTVTSSAKFVKNNGSWVPDPTIYYTTIAKDYSIIGKTAPASLANATTGAIANYAQYGTFTTIVGNANFWSAAQIDAALIVILKAQFQSPSTGIPYHINYQTYSGPTTTVFETFKFDGTNWVKQ